MRSLHLIALLSAVMLSAAACASSHVSQAPNQSPRDQMKANQQDMERDLDSHVNPKPAPAPAAAPASANPAAPAAAPASSSPSAPPAAATNQPASGGMLAATPSNRGTGPLTDKGLHGSWLAGGKITMTFGADGTYTKSVKKRCRSKSKPCPQDVTTGSFSLRRGKLYLNPTAGNAEVYEGRFSGGLLMLNSKAEGKEWAFSLQ